MTTEEKQKLKDIEETALKIVKLSDVDGPTKHLIHTLSIVIVKRLQELRSES